MAISTTATLAELVTLKQKCDDLSIALRQYVQGEATAAGLGRLQVLSTDVDTKIAAVSTAITAATS